jgi:hypothetical protein
MSAIRSLSGVDRTWRSEEDAISKGVDARIVQLQTAVKGIEQQLATIRQSQQMMIAAAIGLAIAVTAHAWHWIE